jgi:predicted negative regulator of RcsB-dependent stress response
MSSTEIGTKTAAQASPQEQVKFVDRINDFMHSNRKVFLFLFSAILVGVVGLGVYSAVSSNLVVKSTIALDGLEASYKEFSALEVAEKASKSATLIAEADTLTSKYGKRYAAVRASLIKAEVFAAINDFQASEKALTSLADTYPKSHLAPVALANAAAIAEDRGDTDLALTYLTRIESSYPVAPGLGRVTLSIGRIYETTKLHDKAFETYTRLIATGVESDWTKIAHDRIILLKSQGLVK